jgi:hypothetical protein
MTLCIAYFSLALPTPAWLRLPFDVPATEVRQMPCRPRSWANPSLF